MVLEKLNASATDVDENRLIDLSDLSFQLPLRRYQKEIVELINIKLERGERQLHIVAPPGAGKTIIGLQLISEFGVPSLVVSPNTTIQAQWGQKADLFLPPDLASYGVEHLIGTHETRPLKPITLLTYQVLSTPGREQELLEKLAHKAWLEEIVRGMSVSAGDAELRIFELMQNNPKAYDREISRHTSRLRRRLTEVLDLKEVLHENALDLLQALRRQKFGLVIFDECHHLTDYWAAVMTHLARQLDDPIIVGLTGTPPEGKSASQETRYLTLVGNIDYQVPTPALVKEGGLAPFQDLVFFCEPTEAEMEYLEKQHEAFHELITDLTSKPDKPYESELSAATANSAAEAEVPQAPDGSVISRLSQWVVKRLQEGMSSDAKQDIAQKHPELAAAFTRYLWTYKLPMPLTVDLSETLRQAPLLDDWMLILEDFALHYLKVSAHAENHRLHDQIKKAIRKLGFGLTEQGIRRQASPVDRVMAFSKSKPKAVARILDTEYKLLNDHLRATVVTDFERMSAVDIKSLNGVLDEESGGAIAVITELLQEPISQFLNPTLVTGSLLLVDERICSQFIAAANEYIHDEGFSFDLIVEDRQGNPRLKEITGKSSEWESRFYVAMATHIFERGITKCLIGTRGIFGEGWDSQALNTLIDLTTITSPVSVKQLRGRSLRINTKDPLAAKKVANNWDVVCIAPALEKGLNDYHRFVRKHDGYFGIADDGHIECGVGHVHPSFSELTPAEVFASLETFNEEMINRALCREKIYELWKVGQPYANRSLGCVEVEGLRKLALTPPHIRRNLGYKAHAKELRAQLHGIWLEYGSLGSLASLAALSFTFGWGQLAYVACAPLVASMVLGQRKYSSLFSRLQKEVCQPNTQESSLYDIGVAILSALKQAKLLPHYLTNDLVKVTIRSDGSYRVFLDDVEAEHSQYFARCFREVMAPISNQPYLIPKYEYAQPDDLGKPNSLQKAEKKFFKAYLRGHAEPTVAAYHPVPKLLARSEKGREAFQVAWNKYVSPGFIVSTEAKPILLQKYFGIGPSLAQRLLWE
jgi:superfamily II DNA or RNA helicase